MRSSKLLYSSLLLLCLAAQPACSPYQANDEDAYAGLVDPKGFLSGYVGESLRPDRPWAIRPYTAKIAGKPIFFYSFPYPVKPEEQADPLFIPWSQLPSTYSYESLDQPPLPPYLRCIPPEGYQYQPALESYRQDEQGSVFTRLPSDTSYRPIVAEIPVLAANQSCQLEKSERLARQHHPNVEPSGRLLVWPVLDPAADVLLPSEVNQKQLPPESALGPQRWGWYRQRLLAYLDGGSIPYKRDDQRGGVRLEAQLLLYPAVVVREVDGKPMLVAGRPGNGDDVLLAARSDKLYSPLCRVVSFIPANPAQPETDATKIQPNSVEDQGWFTYCVQLP